MSRYTDQATRTVSWLELVIGTNVSRPLDVALEHAEAWALDRTALQSETRGGSSSPREIEDKQEAERVQRMALEALSQIPERLKAMEQEAHELYLTVQRLTATVNPERLPADLPSCRSCARSKMLGRQRIGEHFSPVYEKSKSSGLCRWCWDHCIDGELPPIEAVHHHNLGVHIEANRIMAEWERERARKIA